MMRSVSLVLASVFVVALLSACAEIPTDDLSTVQSDLAEDKRVQKVDICHVPPGNPENAHTISVGSPAVDAHLAHGDTLGACGAVECPCEPDSWNIYRDFNGIYCFATDYGRLSVCDPETGGEICVSNYGTAGEVEVDPALCAACRTQFPTDADDVDNGGSFLVESCSDASGGFISSP